ncbi:hypothetical protein CARUB_v10019472mg, partial [Capsella rubella]
FAFFLVFLAVEQAISGFAVVSLLFFAQTHFFQDLSWSNRRVLARVCRSFGFLCVGLFALRTAYSHTLEASVHSVRVDFVCRSLNREAFFDSLDELGLIWMLFASFSSLSLDILGESCLCWHLLLEDNGRIIKSVFSCGWSSSFVESDA